MSILGKAKELTSKAVDRAVEFSSDELIADTVIKAVEKQEKVNDILEKRGSNYRVSEMDLQMGIPPTVVFGIRRISGSSKALSEKEITTVDV